MKFHLIGAGGAGMSVLGRLLLARGHQVSGSDRSAGAGLSALEDAGARVFVGHAPEQVPTGATVIVSSAINAENPELLSARQRGQEIWHRSEGLTFAAADTDFIAVAGAHGKTTTSAMIALALEHLGFDPSWAIGGEIAGGLSGAHIGTGPFVAEADESDRSFLNYHPRIALVTNIEPDHLDNYGSEEAFFAAFFDFAKLIEYGGLLVCCSDSPAALELAKKARDNGIRTWTYGQSPGLEQHCQVDFENHRVVFRGKPVAMNLAVAGQHNFCNAAGALLVGIELGASPTDMAAALGAFRGTGRRFEDRGTFNGRQIVDDYAHHPTEVRATLEMARGLSTGRILVLFQPHLYSRTKIFATQFASALALADEVVVCDVYAAREEPSAGAQAWVITDALPGSRYVPDRLEAARTIAQLSRPGDLIITMGAGDVTHLAPVVAKAL